MEGEEGSETQEVLEAAAVAADEASDVAAEARNAAVDASIAIENANERAEQAEAQAEAIAEGALEGERGRRIDALERELSECRGQLATQDQLLRDQATKIAEHDGALAALVMSAPVSPIPEPSEATPPEPQPVEVTEPNEDGPLVAEAVPVEPVPATVARKRKKWI